MIDLGAPCQKCAAVLVQAQLDGVADPAFVAVLGGLFYMDQQFGEAKRVFAETVKQGFTYDEKTRIWYRPKASPSGEPVRLHGEVESVKSGYVHLQTSLYPDFIGLTTRVGKTILQRGTKVNFEPIFAARGPNAERLQLD